jgi:hypothetical protein
MNNAALLGMFYASLQMMAEHQGRDVTLQRLAWAREWVEKGHENNGCSEREGFRKGQQVAG